MTESGSLVMRPSGLSADPSSNAIAARAAITTATHTPTVRHGRRAHAIAIRWVTESSMSLSSCDGQRRIIHTRRAGFAALARRSSLS